MKIKTHTIEDGDILKIIPRIVDGKHKWLTEVDLIVTKIGIVYDTECKWLRRIANATFGQKFPEKVPVSKRYYINILTKTGEIEVMHIGRSLLKVIEANSQLLSLRSNWHLHIKKEMKMSYPAYDGSEAIENKWIPPVDLYNAIAWTNFIETNQPGLETYFKFNDIFAKRKELIDMFGSDVIGKIISEDREKKLDILGI
jgi:hypothetical protein